MAAFVVGVVTLSAWPECVSFGKEPDAQPRDSGPVNPGVPSIDARLHDSWTDQGIVPAKTADDGVWCRRVFLDLIGRIPTPQELAKFRNAPADARRSNLVHRLLFDTHYVDERVAYWSQVWLLWLVGRGNDGPDTLSDREGLRLYLEDSLRQNLPYHRMAQELVAAAGTSTATSPEFNGAVNYLLHKINNGKTEQATAHIARLFLGRQIECTQCHNHPFNDWKQNQFWELDAFLRQTVALRKYGANSAGQASFVELTDQDFPGEGNHPDQAELYYEQRNGELRVAYPRFLDAPPISASGYLAVSHRRQQLATSVSESDMLAPAIVNRLWSYFLGYGFTRPVDDMGPHNPVSHPEILRELSENFRQSNYDLRQLMQWIVLCRSYQLSSEHDPRSIRDDPLAQPSASFSRFYERPMSPEQLYMSLIVVAQPAIFDEGQPTKRAPGNGARGDWRRSESWTGPFLRDAETDEGGNRTAFRGTIPQTLMLFHGDLTERTLDTGPGTPLGQLMQSRDNLHSKIHQLYLAALSRRPSPAETAAIRKQIFTPDGGFNRGSDSPSQSAVVGLGDLVWALVNSNEFGMVH